MSSRPKCSTVVCDGPFDLGRIGDVGDHDLRLAAALGHGPGDLGEAIRIAGRQRESATELGEPLGRRPSDAGRGAGDEDDLFLERMHPAIVAA